MRVVVFGATGQRGQRLIQQALDQGHQVTGFAPLVTSSRMGDDRLRMVHADVLDPAMVEKAIDGQDVVVSTLGVLTTGPTTVFSQGLTNIIAAMHTTGVRRLLCLSSRRMAAGPSWPPKQYLVLALRRQLSLRGPLVDQALMEMNIITSRLDWTIVRTPRLTVGPLTENYRVAANRQLKRADSLSYPDLAHYLLSHMNDPATFRTTVQLAY